MLPPGPPYSRWTTTNSVRIKVKKKFCLLYFSIDEEEKVDYPIVKIQNLPIFCLIVVFNFVQFEFLSFEMSEGIACREPKDSSLP